MKKQYIKIFSLLALAMMATAGAEAKVISLNTGKGDRLAVVGNPTATLTVSPSLHRNCPTMQERQVVREYAVDSKRHLVQKQAGIEQSMPRCKLSFGRDGASKQTTTVMKHIAG